MIRIRRSAERGRARHGWLDSRHTFSFAEYHDPAHMGFRSLRVINEDRVQPGQGFGEHGHRDMEILSYVLAGGLAHRDSMGHEETLRPGEVQLMSAGAGVRHSEWNASREEPAHFLQIWILPAERGIAPRYGQKPFPAAERANRLRVVASPDARDGSLPIGQDASVYASLLEPGTELRHALAPGRAAWIQVARGDLAVNGQALGEGDGAAIEDVTELAIAATSPSEFLLFDLA